jgi:hypothetical protein
MPMLKYIFKKQLKSTCASPHAWKQDWHCEKTKSSQFSNVMQNKVPKTHNSLDYVDYGLPPTIIHDWKTNLASWNAIISS